MIVLWLLAGSLLVTVPYYIFYDAFNLWPSVYAGGIGAAIYLIALVVYFTKKGNTMKWNALLSAIVLIFCISSYFHWTMMDAKSSWRRSLLGKIRTVIGANIFQDEDICKRTIPVYAVFHKQKGKKKSIVPLFKEIHAGKVKNGMYPMSSYPDFSVRYVHFSGDTMVTLVSVDTVARGLQISFKNANGSIGHLQTTTTLSAQGVHHERNN